ncbi:hypothetical protein ACLOJK_004576 [Asimina triloba]
MLRLVFFSTSASPFYSSCFRDGVECPSRIVYINLNVITLLPLLLTDLQRPSCEAAAITPILLLPFAAVENCCSLLLMVKLGLCFDAAVMDLHVPVSHLMLCLLLH